MKGKKEAKKRWEESQLDEDRNRLREKNKLVKRVVVQAKAGAYDVIYDELETKEGLNKMLKLSKARSKSMKDITHIKQVKDRNGTVLKKEEDILKRWREYFEQLLNEENERLVREDGQVNIYLFYIPWPFPPVWGVADNTKEQTKTMGVSLRSSSNDEGSSRVWMALLEQHSPSSHVFHNLRRFIDAVSPTAPTTGLPLQGNPVATADGNQNCVTIIRHSFLFLARSLASLISILLSFRALFTPSIHQT